MDTRSVPKKTAEPKKDTERVWRVMLAQSVFCAVLLLLVLLLRLVGGGSFQWRKGTVGGALRDDAFLTDLSVKIHGTTHTTVTTVAPIETESLTSAASTAAETTASTTC